MAVKGDVLGSVAEFHLRQMVGTVGEMCSFYRVLFERRDKPKQMIFVKTVIDGCPDSTTVNV